MNNNKVMDIKKEAIEIAKSLKIKHHRISGIDYTTEELMIRSEKMHAQFEELEKSMRPIIRLSSIGFVINDLSNIDKEMAKYIQEQLNIHEEITPKNINGYIDLLVFKRMGDE